MSWDGVPWCIGGGSAEVTADTGRMLVDAIFGGQEGVRSSLHLRVLELATPGPQVRAQPGACVVVNRASGVAYDNQSYAARLPTEDVVDVTPTDAGGGRSDLVVVRVENPHIAGENWSTPSDPVHGPYIFTRIIENVPSNTTSVHQLGLGYSAITLARIDIPASTATITQSMITDLRCVVNPLTGAEPPPDGDGTSEASSKVITLVRDSSNTGDELGAADNSCTNWPEAASFAVPIPDWATRATFDCRIQNIVMNNFGSWGEVRLRSDNGLIVSDGFRFDQDGSNTTHKRFTMFMTQDIAIPASMRGTTQTFRVQGRTFDAYHTEGTMQADAETQTFLEFNFRNTPSYT